MWCGGQNAALLTLCALLLLLVVMALQAARVALQGCGWKQRHMQCSCLSQAAAQQACCDSSCALLLLGALAGRYSGLLLGVRRCWHPFGCVVELLCLTGNLQRLFL
mgnify:CR=1 FL=1